MAGNKQTRKILTSKSGDEYLFTSATDAKLPDANTKLLVGEVEQLTGVSKSKLRRYEDAGVLCPKRTGEGISNNRKLYGIEDLSRLQAITVLREYDFALQEIGSILDNEVDIYDALSEKLLELKRRENQLHNLGLFAHFAEATGLDLIESLSCGPTEFDSLANLMRNTSPYEIALAKLDAYTDDEAEHAFVELDPVLLRLPYIDKNDSYLRISEMIERFIAWWNSFVYPMDKLGYLGFWAVYEDHTLVPERVQTTAGSHYVGYLDMLVFFKCVLDFLATQGSRMKLIAEMADKDVVVAADEAASLSQAIIQMLIGSEVSENLSPIECTELCLFFLTVLDAFIQDEVLSTYLGIFEGSNIQIPEEAVTHIDEINTGRITIPNSNEIERVITILNAIGGDAARI